MNTRHQARKPVSECDYWSVCESLVRRISKKMSPASTETANVDGFP